MSEELKIIAEQLGVTVEYMWPILVRAQYTQALYAVAINVLFFIGVFIGYRVLKKMFAAREATQGRNSFTNADGETLEVISVILTIAALLIGLALFVFMINRVGSACNAEYAALQHLRGWIPGK